MHANDEYVHRHKPITGMEEIVKCFLHFPRIAKDHSEEDGNRIIKYLTIK